LNQSSVPATHDSISASYSLQKSICLVGFMGAGKTTLGTALAKSFQCEFFDLDQVIEAETGKSVAQIFASDGEGAFRALELKALKSLLRDNQPRIVALGGGAFVQVEIEALLRKNGVTVVFLEAPVEILYQRCVDSLDAPSRPLLKDLPSFRKLYDERLPFYRRAELHVSTATGSIEATVREITGRVQAEAGAIPKRMDE
jgi:shikimate kinase